MSRWRWDTRTDCYVNPAGHRVPHQAIAACEPLLREAIQGDFARGQRRWGLPLQRGSFADGSVRYSA